MVDFALRRLASARMAPEIVIKQKAKSVFTSFDEAAPTMNRHLLELGVDLREHLAWQVFPANNPQD